MTLTQVTTGGVDENINIDSNTLKVDGTNNRVGINTASPGKDLEVYNTTGPSISLNDGGDYKSYFTLLGNDLEIRGSNGNVEFYTGSADGASSSERMRITSAGSVGINETSPAARLHVSGVYNQTGLKVTGGGAGYSSPLIVGAANGDEYLQVDDDGRLLCGTTSAINSGYTGGSIHLRNTAGGVVVFKRNDGLVTNSLGILEFHSSFGRAASIVVNNDANHSGSSTPGLIAFSTTPSGTFNTPAERMRIDSAGRVMIGTSSNNGGLLTVDQGGANNIVLRDNSIENHKYNGNAEIAINYNGYLNGTGQFRDFVIYNGKAAHIATFDGSTSRLGVGTTSPSSTVHIKGGSLTVQHGSANTGTGQFNINCENNSQTSFSYDDEGSIVIGTASTPSTQNSFSEKARIDSSGRVMIGLSGTPSTSSLATLTGGNSSSYAYMFIAGGSVSNYKMLKAGGKFITRGTSERNIDLVQAVQCTGNMNILITVKFKLNSAVNGNSGEILCQAKMSATSSGNWNYAVRTPQLTNHFSSGYGTGSLSWVGSGTNTKILRYSTDSNINYTNYMIEEIVITGYDNANTTLL